MILAIDLGTTYFKFNLFDRAGLLVRSASIAPGTVSPMPGWLELTPQRFATALDEGVLAALGDGAVFGPCVEAVTFATQANSFLLLDSADRPLTPLILWPDARAGAFEAEIVALASSSDFTSATGLPSLSHEFMAAKLLWLAQERPELWDQTARLCLISDYLTLILTGRRVTEAGAAALTGLVDIDTRSWRSAALRRLAIAEAWLPSIVGAGFDAGPILADVGKRWNLPQNCRFVVGCLDQYAGALGVGNMATDDGLLVAETTGTVLAAVAAARERMARDATGGLSVFEGPAFVEGMFWRMAFGNVSANYLHWFREQLSDRPSFHELCALAIEVEPGAGGLRLDSSCTTPAQAMQGLVSSRPRGQVVRAILEAVAFALEDHVRNLLGPRAHQLVEVRSAGGGARSDVWLQIKADVLGVPVRGAACPEPTSLGAAILAECALGGAGVRDVADAWVVLEPLHEPDDRRHARYAELRNDARSVIARLVMDCRSGFQR